MSRENLILISQLCTEYQIERALFDELHEFGIIELHVVEETSFIHEDKIETLEKIIRIQQDLNINLEGIDVILNLLQKIDGLQNELTEVKNRLRIYED
jgi:chaperone modulatory protein CbpM